MASRPWIESDRTGGAVDAPIVFRELVDLKLCRCAPVLRTAFVAISATIGVAVLPWIKTCNFRPRTCRPFSLLSNGLPQS